VSSTAMEVWATPMAPAGSGGPEALAVVGDHPAVGDQLGQVGPDRKLGRGVEGRVDLGVDPGHHLGRGAVAGGQGGHDHVLGRGTTVVEWPGGDMADYFASLELLLDRRRERLYPGHGPLVPDAVARVEAYLAHRRDREAQVLSALAAGDRTPAEVVARVYAEVDPALHPAAELSVRAHLTKLVADGRVATDDGERFRPA
jgi:hypothetical protein